MGLWSSFVEFLGLGETSTKTSRGSTPRRSSSAIGTVRKGTITYVGPKFAKIQVGADVGVIFVHEMVEHYVEQASEAVSVGDKVEVLVLSNSTVKPGEFVYSMRAVREARVRNALRKVEPGQLVDATVEAFGNRGVTIRVGQARGLISKRELSWSRVHHPAEVVAVGDVLRVRVLEIHEPEGWLEDRSKRTAHLVASLLGAEPEDKSPTVSLLLSGVPFRVEVKAREPRDFDAVVGFLLESLRAGSSLEELAQTTGLTRSSLDDVVAFAQSLRLLNSDAALTERGERLVRARALACSLNRDSAQGLLVSAAPARQRLLALGPDDVCAVYPEGFPRPPSNKKAERAFSRLTDEDMPAEVIDALASTGEQQVALQEAQRNSDLRVFLRQERGKAWRSIQLEVPERWVYAALWAALKPAEQKSLDKRPHPGVVGAARLHLVELESSVNRPLYWEPVTDSLWLADGHRSRILPIRGERFPPRPEALAERLRLPEEAAIRPKRWCLLSVDGAQ